MYFVYECKIKSKVNREPNDPSYQGKWVEGSYVYFFFIKQVDEYFNNWLRSCSNLVFTKQYVFSRSKWQEFSEIHKVGSFDILTIREPSQAPQYEADKILLKRGISFGSGLHPTTRGILIALEKVYTTYRPKVVMDCGTGSGILAIAAAKLGSCRIIATDISHIALREASKNMILNKVSDKITLILGLGLSMIKPQAVDLLLMNLEWPALLNIIRGKPWSQYRSIIVSGYPASHATVFRQLLLRAGYDRIEWFKIEGWETVILRKQFHPYYT